MQKDSEPAGSCLALALAMQQRAAELGFDWPDLAGVWGKLAEELDELKAAPDRDNQQHELGDVLFSLVNLARFLEIDPEQALAGANARFRRRFAHVEKCLSAAGGRATLEDMEAWWQEAKRQESDKGSQQGKAS